MVTAIGPPLKWHGGKHYLAPKIVALMPSHIHYVEPYAGGLSVLMAKDPDGVSEVVNDIDGDLMNFWTVLQNKALFDAFHRMVEATPFSEAEWGVAGLRMDNSSTCSFCLATGLDDERLASLLVKTHAFFVRCRQSLAGRMKSFAPLSRTRTRRGMNEQASAWLTAVEGLPAVHARLKRVVILSRDALDVIRTQDGPDTLFYLDPPYYPDSRSAPDVYAHEMTAEQHAQMIGVAVECKGKVMISGYRNPLYDLRLAGWKRHEFSLPNNAAGGASKRRMVESVWCNFKEVTIAGP